MSLVANLKGREHLEDVWVANRIIIHWILKQLDGRASTEYIWLGRDTDRGRAAVDIKILSRLTQNGELITS